jgi:hypothetical protein
LSNHGGLTPPALTLQCECLSAKKTIFAMHERRFTRAAGVSPPWYVSSAIAIADAFVQRHASAARWSETTVATATRRISTFRVRIPRTSHGGLTPPALTLQYERSPAKKRFFRCTNAGSQERRASARRGSGNSVATVLVDKQPAGRPCATIAMLPLQVRFSKPRLAHASRSWLHARRSLQKSGCNLQHRAKEQQQQPPQPHIVADMRLRFATEFCFPRVAYAPRSW